MATRQETITELESLRDALVTYLQSLTEQDKALLALIKETQARNPRGQRETR